MRSGRRRPSPGLGRRFLMAGRMSRESCLSYVPEIIRTELTNKYYDEGTSALGILENSLPGNAIKTCNCYRYLPTDWKGTSCNLILVIVGLHKELRFNPCYCRLTQWASANKSMHPGCRDNFRRYNSIPLSPRLSVRDSVFTSKFWSPRYRFRARP